MATNMPARDYGVDVAKEFLQIEGEGGSEQLANEPSVLRQWLQALPKGACFAVEATGTYHLHFIALAHRLGHTVHLIDGYRLNRYRDSIGGRAKNDELDARLLRRYLQREKQELAPWAPPPQKYTSILRLLHRRERLVSARVAIKQSMAEIPGCAASVKALLRRLTALEDRLQRRILAAVQDSGWGEDMRRCQQIEGVGPLTSAALSTVYQRGVFRNSDAFVAFLGLDVRVRDSGKQRGKRKLTKKGDSELRRLLYNAAMKASTSSSWSDFYRRHLERGLSKTQALVALSRKLVRVAFALMRSGANYQPKAAREACTTA